MKGISLCEDWQVSPESLSPRSNQIILTCLVLSLHMAGILWPTEREGNGKTDINTQLPQGYMFLGNKEICNLVGFL